MSIHDIAERLMERKERRLRIGWVDWSSDSWDRRECERRACRIWHRAKGIHTNRQGEPK